MDEAKYKTLKSKHDLLKDAFKKLYSDYEILKGDLTSKIEEYAKLHEENTHLKHSYQLLADELSAQNQKSSKAGHTSWTNPLTLIKGAGQPSTAELENVQKLNDEIAALKLKLESLSAQNELLKAQNLQTTRDLEDGKAKHNVVVTELKDRLIALESILKDLQEQLNKNETKLAQYASEIKALNADIDGKTSEILSLNRSLENLKRDHERDTAQWRLRLNEKSKFDLRRNNFINLNNVYQNATYLVNGTKSQDTLADEFSTHELVRALVCSFATFFKAWKDAMRFESARTGSEESQSTDGPAEAASDPWSFAPVFERMGRLVERVGDTATVQIDGTLDAIAQDFESILANMESGSFDARQYENVSSLEQVGRVRNAELSDVL